MNADSFFPAVQLDRSEVSAPVRAARVDAAKAAKSAKPASGRFWFVFDQWLPVASSPEDEFVLA